MGRNASPKTAIRDFLRRRLLADDVQTQPLGRERDGMTMVAGGIRHDAGAALAVAEQQQPTDLNYSIGVQYFDALSGLWGKDADGALTRYAKIAPPRCYCAIWRE